MKQCQVSEKDVEKGIEEIHQLIVTISILNLYNLKYKIKFN